MNRRKLMGSLGLGTAAFALAEGTAMAFDDHDHDEKEHNAHDEHLKLMTECARLCNEAAHHCLSKLGKNEGEAEQHARVVQLAIDCQDFCVLSATYMARHSPMAHLSHAANADACRMCAEACEKHQDDEIIKRCAEACRECEKACREAAKHGHDHHN